MSVSNAAFEFQDFGSYSVLILLPPLNDEWSQVEVYAKDLLGKVGESQAPRLIMDLNSLDYCGSAVVALMVRVWKNIQERRGVMEVTCASEVVRQVLATARLTDIWQLHERREDAERALGVNKRGGGGSLARRAAGVLFVLALFYGGAAAAGNPEGMAFLPIVSGVIAGVFVVLSLAALTGSPGLALASRGVVAIVFCASLVALGLISGKISPTPAQKGLGGLAVLLALIAYWFAWSTLERAGRARAAVSASRLPSAAALRSEGAASVGESSTPGAAKAG